MMPEFETPSVSEQIQASLVHLLVAGTAAAIGPGLIAWILFGSTVGADVFLLFMLIIGTHFPLVSLMDQWIKKKYTMGLLPVGVPLSLQVVTSLLALFIMPVLFGLTLPAWGGGLLLYALLGQNIVAGIAIGLVINALNIYRAKLRERNRPDLQSLFTIQFTQRGFDPFNMQNTVQGGTTDEADEDQPDVIVGEAEPVRRQRDETPSLRDPSDQADRPADEDDTQTPDQSDQARDRNQ